MPKNSFSTWEEFKDAFVKNFLGTYSRPGTLIELKACKQRRGESLRSFIARWTLLRSSIGVVSEDRAVEAFQRGVWRQDLKEAFGRIQPSTMTETMKIANEWADREDSIREDQQYRMREEGGPSNWRDDRRNKRQRFDGRDAVELVAAGFNNPRQK